MVTERDRSVVAWVAVIGAVSAQDVMARFGVGRTVAYRRLGRLVDYGLLARVAAGLRPARVVHRDQGGAGVGRALAARAGAGGCRDGAALGAVCAAGGRAGAPRALRGVGGAAVARRRARGRRRGRKRAARRPARRAAAAAASGPGAVSPRYGTAGRGRGRAVGQGRPPARADLPRVGALPAGLGGPVLRAGAGGACGFPCRFGRPCGRRHPRPLHRRTPSTKKEAGVVRFAA